MKAKYIFKAPSIQTLDQVRLMDEKFLDPSWTLNSWKTYFENPQTYILITEEQSNRVCGFALYQAVSGDNLAHLLKIAVDPNFRRTGLAKDILKSSFEALKEWGYNEVYLEVESSNLPALALYKGLGFKQLREMKDYYGNGRDAMSMKIDF